MEILYAGGAWRRGAIGLAFLFALVLALTTPAAEAGKVTCKLKGQDKVMCPRGELRGPTGPAGPPGPVAPAPPAPPGPAPFKFLADGPTPTTTFATFAGAVAEAGCDASGNLLDARLRMTADDNAVQLTNLDTGAQTGGRDLDLDDAVSFYSPAPGTSWQLNYMSQGANVETVSFSVLEGGGVAGALECAVYGTAVPG